MLIKGAAVALFCAVFAIFIHGMVHSGFVMGDFKAFYCAGNVVTHHQDPYVTQPLGACESMKTMPWMKARPAGALPAPLPGYEIAFFIPFALLPLPAAALAWFFVSVAALIVGIVLLDREGVAPWPTLLVALSIMMGGISMATGELPQLALAGLALVVAGVVGRRVWCVVFGLALTMMEPQVGLVVAIVLVGLSWRYLAHVVGTFAVLGLISLATLGIAENLEYARVVLPAHILAELPSVFQYGGSWIVQRLGAPDAVAVLVGRITYFIVIIGAFFFGRTARARGNPVLAILAAPALAVVGGPFVHLDHIALVIPAALYLAGHSEKPQIDRIAAAIALATPLLFIYAYPVLIIIVPIIACWIALSSGGSRIAALRGALVAVVYTVVIGAIVNHTGTGKVVLHDTRHVTALAQNSWGVFVRQNFIMLSWTIFLVKLPTWYGMADTAWNALRGKVKKLSKQT